MKSSEAQPGRGGVEKRQAKVNRSSRKQKRDLMLSLAAQKIMQCCTKVQADMRQGGRQCSIAQKQSALEKQIRDLMHNVAAQKREADNAVYHKSTSRQGRQTMQCCAGIKKTCKADKEGRIDAL